jgi:hypothetical protein
MIPTDKNSGVPSALADFRDLPLTHILSTSIRDRVVARALPDSAVARVDDAAFNSAI